MPPPKNDQKHRHTKQAPHQRRKSKPKFEIPAETGSPETPVGWVYRADAVPAAAPSAGTAHPPPAAPRAVEGSGKTNPLLVAGMGLVFVAVGSMGLVSAVALGLFAAPIKMAAGMFRFDRGAEAPS